MREVDVILKPMFLNALSTGAQQAQTQNNFPKHIKHKSVFQNTNQFPETQINFLKHKSISKDWALHYYERDSLESRVTKPGPGNTAAKRLRMRQVAHFRSLFQSHFPVRPEIVRSVSRARSASFFCVQFVVQLFCFMLLVFLTIL